MKIEGTGPNSLRSREPSEGPRLGVRLFAGGLPNLSLGERIRVSVLEATDVNALIDLKGLQVVVEALPALKPGEELWVRVARLFPQPLLEVETLAQEVHFQPPPLGVGQEVTAKVMEQLPRGRLLIAVKGTLFEATAPDGLRVGSELLVRVDQLKPQVVFHILDQGQKIAAEIAQILRAYLPHRMTVGPSLNVLQRELNHLVDLHTREGLPPSLARLRTWIKSMLPDEAPLNPERIATFVRDGGLYYEAKLFQLATENPQALARVAGEDLKGLLLQALQEVATSPFRSVAQNLAASIANHLDHIETQQAANLLAQIHGEPYRLEIPFFSGQGFSTAFLSIEPDGKESKERNGGKGRGYHVLFLLDLEGFGHTRIDGHITSKTLKVIFYVERSGAVTRLRSEFPSFRETLHTLGYEEVFLAAQPFAQLSPEKRQKFDSLTVGVPTSVSLLDIKA